MRITGTRLLDRAAAATVANQRDVATRADAVSSGRRLSRPSDDPAAWLAAQRAAVKRTISEGAGSALAVSRDRLVETDHALGTIFDAVSSVRMLAVQGANASYDAAGRRELASQVRAVFTTALGAANARGSDGEYLLAGSASGAPPFDAAGVYQGDARTRALATADDVTSVVTLAGSELTAARGVEVLPLLERVAAALETGDPEAVRAQLADLGTALEQVARARSQGGGAMATLDDAMRAREQLELTLGAEISRLVDVDLVDAASGLAKATHALEASRAATAHVMALLERTAST